MTKASPSRRKKRVAKKVAKKASKNAPKRKSNGANGKMTLTPQEREALVGRDRQLAVKKVQLANLRLQIKNLEKQEDKVARVLNRELEAFSDVIKELAESKGIDTDAPPEWELNLRNMEFERIKGAAQA